MRRSAFPMGTLVRNCLSEAVTSCSNPWTSGQKDKRKELRSSSRSILTSNINQPISDVGQFFYTLKMHQDIHLLKT